MTQATVAAPKPQTAWLTMTIFVVLVVLYVVELAVTAQTQPSLTPSTAAMLALGALSKKLVLRGGWFRLFTAPFLHGSTVHIIFNGLAFLSIGKFCERFLGRDWLLAIIVVGALAGSLVSLAIHHDNDISVGFSGAIVSLFAALLTVSFRLPASVGRQKLQKQCIVTLVLCMLPLLAAFNIHVDFGAHLGGMIAGLVMGGIMYALWRDVRTSQPMKKIARAVGLLGVGLTLISFAFVVYGYSSFMKSVEMIPDALYPKNEDARMMLASRLLARYPHDPRSYLLSADNMAHQHDNLNAQRMLLAGLDELQRDPMPFKPILGNSMRMLLVASYIADNKSQEAKDAAAPLCRVAAPEDLPSHVELITQQHLCD